VSVGEDGTVTIVGNQGRQQVLIYRNIVNPWKLDIVLRSPLGVVRKIEVDEINNIVNRDVNILDKIRMYPTYTQMEQLTQADILAHIFRQYAGIVEEPTYETILAHIQTLVNSGLVHETVYDVLRNLEHLYMIDELKREQMMETGVVGEQYLLPTVYPRVNEEAIMHQVSDVMPVGAVPEYLRALYNVEGNLKYRNLENMTPYQRVQVLLQQIKQQRQIEQTILTEKVLEQELPQNQYMREMYSQKYQTSPITDLMAVLRGQQYNKYAQVYHQQWTQPQMMSTVAGLRRAIQGVPQQWTDNQIVLNRLAGLERLVQQGQVLPQEINYLRQHYQQMMY